MDLFLTLAGAFIGIVLGNLIMFLLIEYTHKTLVSQSHLTYKQGLEITSDGLHYPK